jgi:hypothetical protein
MLGQNCTTCSRVEEVATNADSQIFLSILTVNYSQCLRKMYQQIYLFINNSKHICGHSYKLSSSPGPLNMLDRTIMKHAVNLSLSIDNSASHHEHVLRSGGVAPPFLTLATDGVVSFKLRPLNLQGTSHWTGGWVEPQNRSEHSGVEKVSCPCRESNNWRPICSLKLPVYYFSTFFKHHFKCEQHTPYDRASCMGYTHPVSLPTLFRCESI